MRRKPGRASLWEKQQGRTQRGWCPEVMEELGVGWWEWLKIPRWKHLFGQSWSYCWRWPGVLARLWAHESWIKVRWGVNRKKRGYDREGRKEMELRQRAELQKRSVNFSLFLCKMEEICVHHWMCKLSYLYISSHGALSHRAKSCWNIL